jgi:hypothetical protein
MSKRKPLAIGRKLWLDTQSQNNRLAILRRVH